LSERRDIDSGSLLVDCALALAALGGEDASPLHLIASLDALLRIKIRVQKLAAFSPFTPALLVTALPVLQGHRLGAADLSQRGRRRCVDIGISIGIGIDPRGQGMARQVVPTARQDNHHHHPCS
jgi:hypothetical protein